MLLPAGGRAASAEHPGTHPGCLTPGAVRNPAQPDVLGRRENVKYLN